MKKFFLKLLRIFKRKDKSIVNEDLSNLSKALNRNLKHFSSEVEDVLKEIKILKSEFLSLKDTFLTLNNALTQKEIELEKFKKGNEKTVIKNYLNSLIDIKELIHGINTVESEKELSKTLKYIEHLCTEYGIEEIVPKVGIDFRGQKGVSPYSETIPTEDESRNGEVVEVLKHGYRLVYNDNSIEDLQPAVAKVLKFKIDEKTSEENYENRGE